MKSGGQLPHPTAKRQGVAHRDRPWPGQIGGQTGGQTRSPHSHHYLVLATAGTLGFF